MHVCMVYMWKQEETSGARSQELELWMTMNCHVGAGNQVSVLSKKSRR